jgi:branched-chain amino acid transport system substrate-binding protein
MSTRASKQLTDRVLTLMFCAAVSAAGGCKKPNDQAEGTGSATPGAVAASPGGGKVIIGVLSDLSGLYSDPTGKGSVLAAQMAVEDFGGSVAGMAIEVVSADHQNKPDIGSTIAREWYDVEHVDAIADVPTSSVAFAVNELTRNNNKVFLASGPGSSDLTGSQCSPNTVHWTYDTWALAHSTGREIVKTGGDTWFFLTADYAFGTTLERDVTAVVTQSGGKVLGDVKHPLNTSDFSSFLLQAQSSKAKIIGLANAGGDTINAIRQAAEFGIVAKGQKLAGLLVTIRDIHALGLAAAQGLIFSESFYWDRDDGTRAWSRRFAARRDGAMPSLIQAGVYSSVIHYLKAVAVLKSAKDGRAVVAKMKELPTEDPLFGKGTIDPNGRKRHPMYLYEVKSPSESKAAWDYYKLIRTVPAEEAFRPAAESGCSLIKK